MLKEKLQGMLVRLWKKQKQQQKLVEQQKCQLMFHQSLDNDLIEQWRGVIQCQFLSRLIV
jgi:hypothetical protein